MATKEGKTWTDRHEGLGTVWILIAAGALLFLLTGVSPLNRELEGTDHDGVLAGIPCSDGAEKLAGIPWSDVSVSLEGELRSAGIPWSD